MSIRVRAAAVTVLSGLCLLSLAAETPRRVPSEQVYRAQRFKPYEVPLDLSETRKVDPWDFSGTDAEGFTYFHDAVSDRRVEEGALCFTCGESKVTLGWGNFENRQPQAERMPFFLGWNTIEMRVRQSEPQSEWTLTVWTDGKASSPRSGKPWAPNRGRDTVTLKGTEWQTLSVPLQWTSRARITTAPDGFGLTIQGRPGNRIQIDRVRILQDRHTGYWRKEVDLPPGKIWRALAEVANVMELTVNGEQVDFRPRIRSIFTTVSVDLAPYLQPGRSNVIGLHLDENPHKHGYSYTRGNIQGRIVMADGSQVMLDAGPGWKGSAAHVKGWLEPGFDDTAWDNAEMIGGSYVLAYRKLPVYDGRIVLEDPGPDPTLYFRAGQPLNVRVRIPKGLSEPQAQVDWILRKVGHYSEKDMEQEVGQGTAGGFAPLDDTSSAAALIKAGTVERGLYSLETTLRTGGRVIEKRLREPLIVLGSVPMKAVDAASLKQGMQATLETTAPGGNV